MSFMQKIFGTPAQQTPPPAPQPNPSNNPQNNPPPAPPHSSAQTDANGVIPPGAATPPQSQEQSPLDKFAKVWETPPTDNQNTPPAGGLTPEKMLEAASKVDFSRVLDQELLKKVTAGGEDAVKALVQVLNTQSQAIYGQSSVVAKKLVDSAVEQATRDFASKVPELVKKHSLKEGLVTENPAFNNPAVAPIVGMIQEQLAAKYPNASSTELQKLAKEYFSGAAQLFGPQSTPSSGPKAKDDIDWEGWINTSTS